MRQIDNLPPPPYMTAAEMDLGPESPGPRPGEKDRESKGVRDWLYPKALGARRPGAIRRLPPERRRHRYLRALNATMANHSLALFHACWSPADFEEALTADPAFGATVAEIRQQVADRAAYLLLVASQCIRAPGVPIPDIASLTLDGAVKAVLRRVAMSVPTGASHVAGASAADPFNPAAPAAAQSFGVEIEGMDG